ncbi:MAG: hypothetical protein ACRDHF_09160, partial [Tepidiformaceae bacterium]
MGEGTTATSTAESQATRHHPVKRLFAFLSAGGLMVAVGAGVFVVTGIAGAQPGPEQTPTAVLSATPTATASSTPAPYTPTPPPPPEPKERRVPLGAISSDRAVVFTGDGDCLNVRPVPSKQFESDPRFCLNEGEIVYLHGDAIEADGETWRYALGRGWLATQYVRMEPRAADDSLGGFESVFLLDTEGSWPGGDGSARLAAGGTLQRIPP